MSGMPLRRTGYSIELLTLALMPNAHPQTHSTEPGRIPLLWKPMKSRMLPSVVQRVSGYGARRRLARLAAISPTVNLLQLTKVNSEALDLSGMPLRRPGYSTELLRPALMPNAHQQTHSTEPGRIPLLSEAQPGSESRRRSLLSFPHLALFLRFFNANAVSGK
jgi:hypothetical protein